MSEHDHQAAVIDWADRLKTRYPDLEWLYAVPNGGDRHPAVAAKLKAEGVKSGVPDLCLPVARRGFHGLYIEMKGDSKARVTPNQTIWLTELNKQGYLAIVCRSVDEAILAIRQYIAGCAGG